MDNITFIVAVRKGSQRVKNKNTRKFGNSSLLEIKLKQVRRVFKNVDILLSSDCQKSLMLGRKYNSIINFRSKKFTNNNVPMPKVYKYLASLVKTKYVCYLHVTSPFLKDESLKEAVKIFLKKIKKNKIDCLASTTPLKEYLWFKKKAINYNAKRHPRSQDLKEVLSLNFAINIVKTNYMKTKGRITSDNYYSYPLTFPETIDIDNKWQFSIGNFIQKKINFFSKLQNDN